VKKQKAGVRAPAFQAHRAGAPSEVDPGIAPVSTSGSVPQRRRSGNALPACIGVDIIRSDGAQNGLPVTLASLTDAFLRFGAVPMSTARTAQSRWADSAGPLFSRWLGTIIRGGD
jgi:hypothetical protein